MRTVPTLLASGAGLSLSSIGLALARTDSPPDAARRDLDMTAVATYTLPPASTRVHDLGLAAPRSFSAPHSARTADWRDDGSTYAGMARAGQKRSLPPRVEGSAMDRGTLERDGESSSRAGAPNAGQIARPRSFLRRLSSSMSTSRDSSLTPGSRPGSATVSQSIGAHAFSGTSTTPMFPTSAPTSLPPPPNKLVKRSSSLRSKDGSPFSSPGSRLPLPIFQRPATSHQRSASAQQSQSTPDHEDRMSLDATPEARDPLLRQYFTPKVAAEPSWRTSTSIPNPIRRVYPDRKYTPILVSAREVVRPADVQLDDGISIDDESMATTRLTMASSVASSPLPAQTAFGVSQAPRRSFSIGDLLSTGPQPLWRRPSLRSTGAPSRLGRRGRQRVASAPQTTMGSSLSRTTTTDSERPSKRRDLTDPQTAQRSIYSSSSSQFALETPPQPESQPTLTTAPQSPFASQHSSFPESPFGQRRLPSATADSSAARHARVSATSAITSTAGSDSESRSVGGYSTDYQSDTVYDSYPTRTTRSSSGKRGPPIDTIFDESPPSFSSGRSTRLRDLLDDGNFPSSEHGQRYRHSTIEEEESIASTPVRSLHDKSVTSTPSARPGAERVFTSSPPEMALMPDPEEIDWDAPQDRSAQQGLGIQQHAFTSPTGQGFNKGFPLRLGAFARSANAGTANSTPVRTANGTNDKANLFDWSEQQPSPSHHNQSPPRPRTVHGKKDPESRSSRPTGGRVPSGMHARSRSVPVVPDVGGKRHNVVANKFGTWGVGSKAVTEDWNEDFDFDEPPPPVPEMIGQEEKRVDSYHEMFVPKSIREQQEKVMANIDLLREWGLLIEELKELRIRAVQSDMILGKYAKVWAEVDGMIELADQQSEEETLEPRRSPPSSPGFDINAFDTPLSNIANTGRPRAPSFKLTEAAIQEEEPLNLNGGLRTSPTPRADLQSLTSRPRKDSEAVARSVIEALQAKRSVSDPTALKTAPLAKKVPFDTATLKHIVPYVNGLKRKVKDALRETEGLYTSPRRRSPPDHDHDQDASNGDTDPPFRSPFIEAQQIHSIDERRSRRENAMTDHDGSDESMIDQATDLANRMQNMRFS